MIPRAMITEWREHAPWVSDEQVEQDLLLSRILVELYSNKLFRENMAFRGGTALFKLFLSPPIRYSEDLDFVQINPEPIGDMIDIVKEVIDPILGNPKRKFSYGRATLLYSFMSESTTPIKLRLKIEINTREHFTVLGYQEKNFEIKSRWFTGNADIRTYHLDELMGTKLRALYQRKKGRDFFDLWIAHERSNLNTANVIKSFLEYMAHNEHTISRALFEMNMHEKLQSKKFLDDIKPLLAPEVEWDTEKGIDVLNEYIAHLPGEAWEGLVEG